MAPSWIRSGAAFIVALGGFVLLARPFPTTYEGWAGWLAIAALAGAIAGRPRRVLVLWIALLVIALLAGPLGWLDDVRRYSWLAAVAAVLAVSTAFIAGTGGAWQPAGPAAIRTRWAAIGRTGRWLVAGATVLALLGLAGYSGYAFLVGGPEYVAQPPNPSPCDNPGQRYGWAFEPINYDATGLSTAYDPSLRDVICDSAGPPAGGDVVSSDGISIAGWYIPATAAIGPTGPTVVIVHGGQASKMDGLRYAPPFHAEYNIVLIDLRNAGQSGGDESSGGLREQLDLRAMLDWLERTKQPSWIAVMGNSNGASTALAEARTDPRVRALILDSMHSAIELQMGNVIEQERRLPPWPAAIALVAGASARLGGDLASVDPIRTITQVGDRPILLTHGTADVIDRMSESVERNVAAALEAGVDVELHVCPGAGHGEVIDACGEQWGSWVTAFLAAARGEGGGG